MSTGKKVKINIKKSPKSDPDLESGKMTEGDGLMASELAEDMEGQLAENGENLASQAEDRSPRKAGIEEQRLEEFLARDVDFSELEEKPAAQDPMAKLKAELAQANDKYLRAIADLENFRKHSLKERSELLKYQGEKVILDLLEVLDNFELALQHKDAELESLRTGLTMIHKQMLDVLERWGVKAEDSVGKPFDPNKHNAINKVASNEVEPGSIVAELKKPYFYKDKLLRVGNVVVADGSAESEQ